MTAPREDLFEALIDSDGIQLDDDSEPVALNRKVVRRDLRAVRRVVSSGWMQGNYAVDARGRMVDPESKRARRRCIIGAIQRVTLPLDSLENLNRFLMCEAALEQHIPAGKPDTAQLFNDAPQTTKGDVIKWIDRTVRAMKPSAGRRRT